VDARSSAAATGRIVERIRVANRTASGRAGDLIASPPEPGKGLSR
jgi:hypothetical protein